MFLRARSTVLLPVGVTEVSSECHISISRVFTASVREAWHVWFVHISQVIIILVLVVGLLLKLFTLLAVHGSYLSDHSWLAREVRQTCLSNRDGCKAAIIIVIVVVLVAADRIDVVGFLL